MQLRGCRIGSVRPGNLRLDSSRIHREREPYPRLGRIPAFPVCQMTAGLAIVPWPARVAAKARAIDRGRPPQCGGTTHRIGVPANILASACGAVTRIDGHDFPTVRVERLCIRSQAS